MSSVTIELSPIVLDHKTEEEDHRRAVPTTWEFKKYLSKDCPYLYFVPSAWLRRAQEFRTKKNAPYPGPIDFRILTSESVRKFGANESYDSIDFGAVKAEYYHMMADHYGIIGTPVVRQGEDIKEAPYDFSMGEFCEKVYPKSITKQRELYTEIKKLGFTGDEVKEIFSNEKKVNQYLILYKLRSVGKKQTVN